MKTLCRLVGHKTPREADPEHTWFTYELRRQQNDRRRRLGRCLEEGFFGWEAKGTHKSLERAYEQLKMYADALQNPPLLVVTDLRSIVVHTNFTNAVKREIRFTVDQLDDYATRQILDAVFNNPEALRPGTTRTAITQEAAEKFTRLAQALRARKHDPQAVAHFLNRLVFCMFAEDIGLLPSKLFTRMVTSSLTDPAVFEKRSGELFAAMHKGGDVAFENVDWFNGGLFDDDATLRLEIDELKLLAEAARLDWSEIEPSIFGTLFERGLDPTKRSQLGAHYTDPDTIMKLINKVIVEPWLREWEEEKIALAKMASRATKKLSPAATKRFTTFLERLRAFTVLDPACGSGNFLYLALRALKDIEKRVLIEAEALGLGRQFPGVGPASVRGIEINTYAAELARITVWIGEIQWMVQNGYGAKKNPILERLDQIENRDALLHADGSEAVWPNADVIVGNPPFLGGSKMLRELEEPYVERLRQVYDDRVPGGADLVCYWFEKANDVVRSGTSSHAGLVATNSIRGGSNREVLNHISQSGRIYEAWSDEEWFNEGAGVRVSLICFSTDTKQDARLDGRPVVSIYPDLTGQDSVGSVDLTKSKKLGENSEATFSGTKKGGNFDVAGDLARFWLGQPNPNGRPNSDVVRPWVNGSWLVRRPHDTWIIDYRTTMTENAASQYELPYAWIDERVRPVRATNRRASRRDNWWLHSETCVGMRRALNALPRYIATSRVSKHRLFCWLHPAYLIDDGVYSIAKDDDTTFGILHSRFHEIWSLRMCTYLGVGNDPRYTPTTCFETFPFPEGLTPNIPAADYASDPRAQRIAAAAQALVEARDRWLNPPEWKERVPEVVAGYPDRIIAKAGHEADLKKRTLTNLYNTRPTWLANLHNELDTAVATAYGWPWPLTDDEILRHLFELNHSRSAAQ